VTHDAVLTITAPVPDWGISMESGTTAVIALRFSVDLFKLAAEVPVQWSAPPQAPLR
jgi:hypothetical protein